MTTIAHCGNLSTIICSPQDRYFNNPALSDVVIHFSGRQVKAHKVILASQSEHFRAMFEGGFAEASAHEVHLYEDDPEAMYGALAYCYGIYYDGNTTFDTFGHGPLLNYDVRRTDRERNRYIINLYTTGGEYMMAEVQAHAEWFFNALMGTVKPSYVPLFSRDPEGRDTWMVHCHPRARLLYWTLGESVKELRPAFANAVWRVAHGLSDHELFQQMMLEAPELALDVLNLALDEKKEAMDT